MINKVNYFILAIFATVATCSNSMELSHSDDTIKHNGNESHAKEVTGKEDKEYDMRFPESGASSFETERSERYKHTCEESKKQRAELP